MWLPENGWFMSWKVHESSIWMMTAPTFQETTQFRNGHCHEIHGVFFHVTRFMTFYRWFSPRFSPPKLWRLLAAMENLKNQVLFLESFTGSQLKNSGIPVGVPVAKLKDRITPHEKLTKDQRQKIWTKGSCAPNMDFVSFT